MNQNYNRNLQRGGGVNLMDHLYDSAWIYFAEYSQFSTTL